MKRIAFYGGSFDPLHNGHLTIARKLTEVFQTRRIRFYSGFSRAAQKKQKSDFRISSLRDACSGDEDEPKIKISKMELDAPERPFTFETLTKLRN